MSHSFHTTLAILLVAFTALHCDSSRLHRNAHSAPSQSVHTRQAWYNPKGWFAGSPFDARNMATDLAKLEAKVAKELPKADPKRQKKLNRLQVAIEGAKKAMEDWEKLKNGTEEEKANADDWLKYQIEQVNRLNDQLGWKPFLKTAGKIGAIGGLAGAAGVLGSKYGDDLVRRIGRLFKQSKATFRPGINKLLDSDPKIPAAPKTSNNNKPLGNFGPPPLPGQSPPIWTFALLIVLCLIVLTLGGYLFRRRIFGSSDAGEEPEELETDDQTVKTKKRKKTRKSNNKKRKKHKR